MAVIMVSDRLILLMSFQCFKDFNTVSINPHMYLSKHTKNFLENIIQTKDIKNRLIYYNWKDSKHYQFHHILFDNNKQLKMNFSRGIYKISNVKVSTIGVDQLKKLLKI